MFADGKFKSFENGRKFSKRLENTVGKERIARYEQFFFFPRLFPVFSEDLNCRHVKPGLFRERVKNPLEQDFYTHVGEVGAIPLERSVCAYVQSDLVLHSQLLYR